MHGDIVFMNKCFPGRSIIKGSPGFLPVALKAPLCSAYVIAPNVSLFLSFSKMQRIFLSHVTSLEKMYELNEQKDRQQTIEVKIVLHLSDLITLNEHKCTVMFENDGLIERFHLS